MTTTAARGPRHGGQSAEQAAEKAFCALGPVAGAFFITGAAAAGHTRLGSELAKLNTLRAAHGEQEFLAALSRAVAFGRWRAADVRSILAAGPGTAIPQAGRGGAGARAARRPGPAAGRLRHRRAGMTAAAPPLAPDLTEGLRRLKLAAMRRLAPELLLTAKTQRWAPEELLRTLVEAEISARDASNARTRLKAAAFPVTKTLDEFDLGVSSVPKATFTYLASLEWIRARENLCLVARPGTGKSHLLVALGVAAVAAGRKVRYFTAAELTETLYRGLADEQPRAGHRHPAPQRPHPDR